MAEDGIGYICRPNGCVESGITSFATTCELERHMDKHAGPFPCQTPACNDSPGFTYSNKLLRDREEQCEKMLLEDHLRSLSSPAQHPRRICSEHIPQQANQTNTVEGSVADTAGRDRPLRKRILEESKKAAQLRSRRPQSKWFKAPPFPGMAAFDLDDGMSQIPCTKKTKVIHWQSPQHAHDPDTIPEAATWSSDEHSSRIMAELDDIERAASASSASSSSNTSPSGPDAPANIPPPPMRPISETQLINEVKGIYAELVMVEKECVEVVAQQSRSTRRLGDDQWKALVTLHRTLLQDHHDFFSASQHPSASAALKRLAIKYAMPARMWRTGFQNVLNLLKQRIPTSQASLASFTDLAYTTMKRLEEDVPELSHEWALLKYNIKEYFAALRTEGFDIPMSFIDRWGRQYSPTTRWIKSLFPPMIGDFFGDDPFSESLFWALLDSESNAIGENGYTQAPSAIRLSNLGQYLMAGWLQYGRKIATSFQAFTHVFIFLALLGATAYSMGSE